MSNLNELHEERTSISLSKQNYDRLKKYGCAGQSLNDALTTILDQVEEKGEED